MSYFLESPALFRKEHGYPYGDRVPKKIRMITTVFPAMAFVEECFNKDLDPPLAIVGCVFLAYTNSYGGVAARFPNGLMLSVRPDQFDIIEWFE